MLSRSRARSARLLVFCAVALSASLLASPGHAADWRGYLDVEGRVGGRSGETSLGLSPVTLGWSLAFGAGIRPLPVMLGLGAGITYLGGGYSPGPTTVVMGPLGSTTTDTQIHRSLQLRHLEVIARISPDWQRVRPFFDASLGVGALWHETRLEGDWQTLDTQEEQRAAALAYGFAGGIEIEPWARVRPGFATRPGHAGWVFTLGLRSLNVGSLDEGRPVVDGSGHFVVQGSSGSLHLWETFVAVGISFDGAADPGERAPGEAAPENADPGT